MSSFTSIHCVYDLANYKIDTKPQGKVPKNRSNEAWFDHLKTQYASEGVRRTVEAAILVHQHGHPCLLMIEQRSADGGR